jgi:hypothetical protein
MSVVVAALMCHAPIVVPAIGAERAVECAATTRAMRDVAAEVVRHAPEVLVLITPHAPRRPRAWGVCADAHVQGDFGRFGHAAVGVALPGAADVAQSLAAAGAVSVSRWKASRGTRSTTARWCRSGSWRRRAMPGARWWWRCPTQGPAARRASAGCCGTWQRPAASAGRWWPRAT